LHFDICVPRGSLPSDWSSMPEEALAAAVFRAMPLAVYWGESEFNRALADLANLLGVELDARVKCESFLEAARMLQLGRVAAILPDLASQELDRVRFHVFGRDLLKHAQRTIVLAWNKRNLEVRPSLARAKNHLLHAIAESLARGPESKPESQSTGRD
jgi:DNA-binding transcriptional LysR family regulator